MAERQLLIKKIQENIINGKLKSVATQTGSSNDLLIYLTDNKSIRVYYSHGYKQVVLSFNFGSKSFIITKNMWLIFKKNFIKIDDLLND